MSEVMDCPHCGTPQIEGTIQLIHRMATAVATTTAPHADPGLGVYYRVNPPGRRPRIEQGAEFEAIDFRVRCPHCQRLYELPSGWGVVRHDGEPVIARETRAMEEAL